MFPNNIHLPTDIILQFNCATCYKTLTGNKVLVKQGIQRSRFVLSLHFTLKFNFLPLPPLCMPTTQAKNGGCKLQVEGIKAMYGTALSNK